MNNLGEGEVGYDENIKVQVKNINFLNIAKSEIINIL